MPRTGTRAEATDARKQAIRRAALDCFAALGYEKTTMADIRRRAGASTGSIYHHFKSKQQLAADLYLSGVRETQEYSLHALLRHRSAERGVRAMVRSYLEWIADNPDFAKFLFTTRHAEFMDTTERDLDRLNAEFLGRIREWVEERIARGELPALSFDVYRALLVGPSEYLGRLWLSGRLEPDLKAAATQLAAATWQALRRT